MHADQSKAAGTTHDSGMLACSKMVWESSDPKLISPPTHSQLPFSPPVTGLRPQLFKARLLLGDASSLPLFLLMSGAYLKRGVLVESINLLALPSMPYEKWACHIGYTCLLASRSCSKDCHHKSNNFMVNCMGLQNLIHEQDCQCSEWQSHWCMKLMHKSIQDLESTCDYRVSRGDHLGRPLTLYMPGTTLVSLVMCIASITWRLEIWWSGKIEGAVVKCN